MVRSWKVTGAMFLTPWILLKRARSLMVRLETWKGLSPLAEGEMTTWSLGMDETMRSVLIILEITETIKKATTPRQKAERMKCRKNVSRMAVMFRNEW